MDMFLCWGVSVNFRHRKVQRDTTLVTKKVGEEEYYKIIDQIFLIMKTNPAKTYPRFNVFSS